MCQLIFETEVLDLKVLSGIICICYLIILSVQDVRNKNVSLRLLLIGLLVSILYQLIWSESSLLLCAAGAAVGVGFIGISKVTKEGIGYGDSILILTLGIYMGLWEVIYLLIISFLLSAVFSMGVLTVCHYNRKKSIPFIPFLTVGYILLFLWETVI